MSFFVPPKRPTNSGFKAPVAKQSNSNPRLPESDDREKLSAQTSAPESQESEVKIPARVGPQGDSVPSQGKSNTLRIPSVKLRILHLNIMTS